MSVDSHYHSLILALQSYITAHRNTGYMVQPQEYRIQGTATGYRIQDSSDNILLLADNMFVVDRFTVLKFFFFLN